METHGWKYQEKPGASLNSKLSEAFGTSVPKDQAY
jgi:hypothetical protein